MKIHRNIIERLNNCLSTTISRVKKKNKDPELIASGKKLTEKQPKKKTHYIELNLTRLEAKDSAHSKSLKCNTMN